MLAIRLQSTACPIHVFRAVVLLAAPRNPDSNFGLVIPKVNSYVNNFMVKAYGYAVSNDPTTKGSPVTLPFQPIKPITSDARLDVGSVTGAATSTLF